MSTDEIRSLVAATRAVAKAERERDEARAERDKFEMVIGHIERAADDFATCSCEECEGLRAAAPRLRIILAMVDR